MGTLTDGIFFDSVLVTVKIGIVDDRLPFAKQSFGLGINVGVEFVVLRLGKMGKISDFWEELSANMVGAEVSCASEFGDDLRGGGFASAWVAHHHIKSWLVHICSIVPRNFIVCNRALEELGMSICLKTVTKHGKVIHLMSQLSVNVPANPDIDPMRHLVEHLPDMINRTRGAALTGYSWRGFLVGAGGLMQESDGALREYYAGNLKRESKQKVCAEPRMLGRVGKKTTGRMVGIVVAATTDVDLIEEVSLYRTPTLHCCIDCQHKLVTDPHVDEDTMMVTAGIDKDVYQAFTVGWMTDTYRKNDKAQIEQARAIQGFDKWDKRLDLYDKLTYAETQMKSKTPRTPTQIAQMVLMATITRPSATSLYVPGR